MRPHLNNNVAWVVSVLVIIWFLYLAYKIAQHVNAWPFG